MLNRRFQRMTSPRVLALVPCVWLCACAGVTDSVFTSTTSDDMGDVEPDPRSVVAGPGNTCAVNADGTIACWGDTAFAMTETPRDLFSAVALSVGFACGIREDGTPVCWGHEQVSPAAPPEIHVQTIAMDDTNDACSVTDQGEIECWSYDGAVAVRPGTYEHLSVRWDACAIQPDGALACFAPWSNGSSSTPPSGTFLSVSNGCRTHCAVATSGQLACWDVDAADPDPQATAATNPESLLTVPVPAGTFTSVSVGKYGACAIRGDGTLLCWGNESFSASLAQPPTEPFSSVSVGWNHACGIAVQSGEILCWGDDSLGQTEVPIAPLIL